ncbi:hypothetical protein MNBD_GAMMA26-1182 [hydrothermal vent metagenome]|uniref:Uncharacterized protein n=1 Tax=hydrothermal vent metagenome TaxID=652676 RepID=A0A3B1BGY9_9ZZZZ
MEYQMKPSNYILKLISLVGLLLCGAQWAYANVTTVSTSSSPQQAALGRTSTVVVNWSVQGSITVYAPVNPATIKSGPLQFTAPDLTVLGSQAKTLTKPNITGSYNVTFTETVTIPSSVIYSAYKRGDTALLIQRRFWDTSDPGYTVPVTAAATVTITSSAAAGFNISRQELAFDNGSYTRRILRDEPIHAVAQFKYSGSGLLRGVWELATPSTTYGEPVYRRLKNVRKFFGAGGTETLRSPPLESNQQGRYLIRFRVEEPATGFDDLVLEYFVGQEMAHIIAPPITLELIAPNHGTFLHPKTTFHWRKIANAKAYRLDLYKKNASLEFPVEGAKVGENKSAKNPNTLVGAPATGKLVPATTTQLLLSAISRERLQPGYRYWWRIIAIGTDGSVISQSPVREIRFQ